MVAAAELTPGKVSIRRSVYCAKAISGRRAPTKTFGLGACRVGAARAAGAGVETMARELIESQDRLRSRAARAALVRICNLIRGRDIGVGG